MLEEETVRKALMVARIDPSPEFLNALLPQPREKIVTGGWRAGKSTEGAAEVWCSDRFWNPEYPAVFWIVGPTYSGVDAEYGYLWEWASRLNLIESVTFGKDEAREMRLKCNTTIETRSSQHPERLASAAIDGALVVEAGQQPEETRIMLRGRTLDKRGWRRYTGTLEDAENHARWAWYEKLAAEWQFDRNADHASYALPTWGNRTIFAGGRDDPEIQAAERELSAYQFARRIAGEPVGVEHAIYPQLDRAKHMPLGGPRVDTVWDDHVIGVDAGGVHNSVVSVVGKTSHGEYWLREVWAKPTDDHAEIAEVVAHFKEKYGCWRGRTDPRETYLASFLGFDYAHRGMMKSELGVSETARESRIRVVSTHLTAGSLKLDMNGPGVEDTFEEMRVYHRRVTPSGKLEVVREGEDRVAALEYAMEEFEINTVQWRRPGHQTAKRKRPAAIPRPFRSAV